MPAFAHVSSSSASASACTSPSKAKSRPIASSSSGWIQSEQRPSSAASIQTLLLPNRVLDQGPKLKRQSYSEPARTSASPTRYRQAVLFPGAVAMTKRTDAANALPGGSKAVDAKDKDKEKDLEALDAIRAKVSQFQPKISAMLPRMMDKGTTDSKTSETPSDKSRKIAVEAPPLSKAKNAPAEETPMQHSSATSKRVPPAPTMGAGAATASSSSKIAVSATTVSVKATTTQKTSKGKREPAAQSTSIADLIPKGSRTKPLAQKGSVPAHQSQAPGPSRQTEAKDTAVIVLSSSLPSFPMDEDSIMIDGNGEPAAATTMVQAGTINQEVVDEKTYLSIATTDSSFGSDSAGDTMPSIAVNHITRWMGGVQEAMQQEQIEKADLDTSHHLNTTYTREAATAGLKASTTSASSKAPPEQAVSKASESGRRSTLRRPPQPLNRGGHLARSPPIFEVLSSSLPEESQDPNVESMEGLLQEHPPHQQQESNATSRVLVKDSIPTHVTREDTDNLLGGLSKDAGGVQESAFQSLPSFLYKKDDEEMVDSLAVKEAEEAYYRRNLVEEVEEMLEPVEPQPAPELEQEPALPSLPSLPSELTASCLEELGLKRKNSMERSERKIRAGRNLSKSFLGGLQEEQDEDEETSPILAQPSAVPSSLGLALSTTASSLPQVARQSGPATRASPRQSVIISSGGSEMVASSSGADDGSLMLMEEPKYVPLEVPRRARISRNGSQLRQRQPVQESNEDNEEEEEQEVQESHEQSLYSNHPANRQHGMDDDPTFPSPPSLDFTFSTLPSMPSLPSFSSSQTLPSMQASILTLQSEPSLVMLSTLDDDSTQPSRLRPQERQE